ncbi:MAG TPA: DUF4350 domain-containing protein [Geobacteraceae bacterium]
MTKYGAAILKVAMVFFFCAMGETTAHAAGTIIFDEGHGERFVTGNNGPLDLSSLADVFRRKGLTVKPIAGPLDDGALAAADGIVISGPFSHLTQAEIDSILRFMDRGGELAVMLHIAEPAAELLHTLGVDFSNRIIHEQSDVVDNDSANFRVTRFESHPLFAGVKRFTIHGGWALAGFAEGARAIASTSPSAWVDLDGDGKLSAQDVMESFGVVVTGSHGKGAFVVFGDDAIFQNKFLDDDNGVLAGNLATWFSGIERGGGRKGGVSGDTP